MPAKSAAQQKAAGAALSAKRGDTAKSSLKGASKSMLSMSESELEKMASTKRNGKPEHKSKNKPFTHAEGSMNGQRRAKRAPSYR